MTAQDGANVLLAAGDGAGSETFATIGGMRITAMTLSNRPVDATHAGNGEWRELLAASGQKSVSISGRGTFTGSAAEETLRGYAFAASRNNYRITFPNADVLSGPFIVAAYTRQGQVGDEETFALTLESAGEIEFSAA